MKTRNKIRLGIIGCGKVSHERHMPALKRIPEFEIIAACNRGAARLDAFAEKYKVPHRYPDYRELLANPDVDAVAVLTTPDVHTEIGVAAMDAGKHVFMEKPLALTEHDCDQLIEKSRAVPTKNLLCLNNRWHRLVRKARAIVQSGELGTIKAVRSVYTHFRDGRQAPEWHRAIRTGGGVTVNESGHHFDLWTYLLGEEVTRVFAFSENTSFYEDESCVMNVRLTNGIMGSIYNSFSTSPNSEIEIYGDGGRLYLNLYKFDGLDVVPAKSYPGHIPDRIKKMFKSGRQFASYVPILRHGGDFPDTFYHIWRHFAECVLHDQTPECTYEDGKRAINIALAAVKSFKSNAVVTVNGTDHARIN